MPYVIRDGMKLYYEKAGHGGPPIVFVHGWCCDHFFFRPQFDHFKQTHTVMTLDLRGCGSSDKPEHGYDIPTLADDVAWMCSELRLLKPVLVGHSLGGMIGVEIAARYPALPGAIVAVDPGPIDPLPMAIRFFESFVTQLEGPSGEVVRRAYIDGMFVSAEDAERGRWIAETMCSVPMKIAADVIRGVIAWNGVGALQLCKSPLAVLLADCEGSNAPDRLLALKRDTQIGVTIGAGHFHQLEVPEQVTSMIEKFIHTVCKAPALAA